MKKVFGLLITLAMLISTAVVPVSAEGTTTLSGTGIETDPYIIATADDLKLARDMINADTAGTGAAAAYYKVTADITLPDGESWTPIGVYSTATFKGHFDGGNHAIKNISIVLDNDSYDANYTAAPYLGFFGRVHGATISNLGIENVVITNDTTWQSNTVSRKVSGIGGFAGCVNSGTTITDCYVKNANLQHRSGAIAASVGGFVGCGGGNATPSFKNCYVYGATLAGTSVSNRSTVHGFIGAIYNTSMKFENCYTADVATTQRTVELTPFYAFGHSWYDPIGDVTYKAQTITNCYSEADDIACPENDTHNYDVTKSAGTIGMTKVGLVEAMTAVGYVTDATINNGYPCLAWEIPEDTLTGSGTEADPYMIESASDLKAARDLINNDTAGTGAAAAYYEVTADIDLENEEWVPIAPFGGHSSHVNHAPFTGTFNGNGHVIKNINIPLSGTYNSTYLYTVGNVSTVGDATASPQTYSQGPAIGLFGFMNGTVTDLGIDGITVSNTSSWCNDTTNNWNHKFYAFGSIAGAADGTFERCYVKNANISYNGKSQASTNGIGGFIGIMSGGTYNDCYVNGLTAAVLNTQTVSISGFAATGTSGVELTNCYVANAAATFAEGNTATFYAFMQGGSTNYPSTPRKLVNCFSTASDSKETTISRGTVGQTAETISTTLLAVENTNWKSGTGINSNGAPALSWETAPVAAVVAPYVIKQVSTAKDTVTLEINKADTTGDKIYIATYDSEGRLIAADVQNVAATITTAVSAEGAATVKVFIWNGVTPEIDAVVKTSY